MVKTEFGELKDEVERLKKTVTELGKETACIGAILPYGGELVSEEEQKKGVKVPEQQELLEEQGWLFCDGRAVNREYYRRLYEVIGANFGALDKDHFNLPDLRGRFVRGVDHGAGRDPDASSRGEPQKSGNEGDAVGSVQEEEFKQHRHKYDRFYNNQGGGFLSGSGRGLIESGVETDYKEDTSKAFSPKKKDLTPPGGTETRPKNIYVEWIIYAGKKKKG
jgi:phage-related tail fiber protein